MLDQKNTVVIILGASKWPNIGTLQPDVKKKENLPAPFENSVNRIIDYFCNSLGVNEKENILCLFDSEKDVCGLMNEVFDFLSKKNFAGKIHLFFYYVGHGVVSNPLDNNYFVYLRSSHENRKVSQFPITNLEDVIGECHCRQIKIEGCYIIIDACYSGAASKHLKNALNRLAEDRIKVDTVLLCSSLETHISAIREDGQSTLFTSALLDSLKSERKETWSFQDLRSKMEDIIRNRYRGDSRIMPYVDDIYSKGGGDSGHSYTKIFPPFPYQPQVNLEREVFRKVRKEEKDNALENALITHFSKQGHDIANIIEKMCRDGYLRRDGPFICSTPKGRNKYL